MHPPYSPNLAPSDYHLFRTLQNSLNDVNLPNSNSCQNQLDHVFCQQVLEISQERNLLATRKVEEGYRLKWRIHN